MSSALFGSAARSSSKNLIEFRAGKMHLKNKMVHADKRKGLLYLYQSDDQLMHFCWKDRSTGAIEEDLIIFPDDCEYKRIPACTTGRAYVLIFRSSSRRLFFWMQEPKTEKDDDNCRKINDYMNNPPIHGSSRGGSSGGGGSGVGNAASSMLSGDLANLRDSDLQSLIGNISQQQLMQILSSGSNLGSLLSPTTSSGRSASSSTPTTASTPTPTEDKSSTSTPSTPMDTSTTVAPAGAGRASTTTTSSASASTKSSDKEAEVIKLADLQNILTNIMTKDDKSGAGSSQSEGVDLSPVMNADALRPILANKDFLEKLKPYLPETGEQMPTSGLLRATVNSPQFKQAVSVFSQALQTGELGPLVQQFGLGQEAVVAAASGNMEAFLKALSKNQESSKEKKDDDDDDSMAVD